MSTDEEWEKWGKNDPYYGVITVPRFRKKNLSEAAKEEFFDSGRRHIDQVINTCRTYLDKDFVPKTALDFGCGTGRLVIPLGEILEEATGVDISDSMLCEARINCQRYKLENVRLVKSDDQLSALDGQFDFVHSFIVLQHIPVERGRHLFHRLLDLTADGGICAIQLTYAKSAYADFFGYPPAREKHDLGTLVRKLRSTVKKGLSVLANIFRHADDNEEEGDPEMQMNPYLLNELFFMIQSSGVPKMWLEFTDHTGDLGVYLYFQKPGNAKTM